NAARHAATRDPLDIGLISEVDRRGEPTSCRLRLRQTCKHYCNNHIYSNYCNNRILGNYYKKVLRTLLQRQGAVDALTGRAIFFVGGAIGEVMKKRKSERQDEFTPSRRRERCKAEQETPARSTWRVKD